MREYHPYHSVTLLPQRMAMATIPEQLEFIKRNGDVIQHNDVVQELVHGGPHNCRSIGIDIVNDPDPQDKSTVKENTDQFIDTKWATESVKMGSHTYPYRLPTKSQMDSLYRIVEFLTDNSDISVPIKWPGIVYSETENEGEGGDPYFMFYPIQSLNDSDSAPVYNSGVLRKAGVGPISQIRTYLLFAPAER